MQGKAASRRNAIKHGLASTALRPRSVDQDLVDALAPPGSSEEQRELAYRVMEATQLLEHAHLVRTKQALLFECTDLKTSGVRDVMAYIERYEQSAQARLRKAAKRLLTR